MSGLVGEERLRKVLLCSVGEALAGGIKELDQEGMGSARLDAELLLADSLGVTRSQLYARLSQRLTPEEREAWSGYLARRKRGEPLAYMLGRKEFYGLDFHVDRRALIPRPETELLVEKGIELGEKDALSLIADIGTGSGCIAISLAKALPGAKVYAVDISSEALTVAAINCERHGVRERIDLLLGDLLEPLPEPVELIVANLPYVSEPEFASLTREIRDYEPRIALDGGRDGLALLRRLLIEARGHLKPHGNILLEIGATQGSGVIALARRSFSKATLEIIPDYAGLDRMLCLSDAR